MLRKQKDKHGNILCPHKKRRSHCSICMPCPHGRLHFACRECGGRAFCEHGKFRMKCADCHPLGVFKSYQSGAKKRNIQFSLTFEEYLRISGSPCMYCGASEGRNGVDRKDNSVGYTTENSKPCCSKCNLMKRDYSIREFLNHVRKIYKFKRGNQ